MDFGLHNKVALVTGGSRGIGAGIAKTLAQEGARVAIASRSEQHVNEAASAIGAHGYVFDSSDLDAIPGLVEQIEGDFGSIDIYIANTGGPPSGPDPLGYSVEQWQQAHQTLVLSPMIFLKRLLPTMRKSGWGRVVAIGSSSVREPIPYLQLSNAHRSGVVSAFKVLAREVAKDGVTLNTILPGRIKTARALELFASEAEADESARTEVPAGRLGTVEEIGAAVAFLCSQQASYITGTTLLVDGGLTKGV